MTNDENAERVDLDFLIGRRIQFAISTALEAMPADDKAERIAWCQETGQHGTHVVPLADGLALVWADRPLAFLPKEVLTEESLLFASIEGDGKTV